MDGTPYGQQAIDNIYGQPVLWRETMRAPRMAIFDARLLMFFVFFLVHLRVWTFATLVTAIILFALIERAGYRLPSALRAMRSALAGVNRPARPRSTYRAAVDYAFEGRPHLTPRLSLKTDTKHAAKKMKAATETHTSRKAA